MNQSSNTGRKFQRSRHSWQFRLATGLATLLLVTMPLMFGGMKAWTQLVGTSVLLLACWLGWWIRLTKSQRVLSLSPVFYFILFCCCVTALQLVPMPMSWLEVLSPEAHGIRTLRPLVVRAWAPISLEPYGTLQELLKLVGCLAGCFMIELGVWRNSAWRAPLISMALGVLMLGVLHSVFGWQTSFNQYNPNNPPAFVSSFVNPNHAAGFLGFVSFVFVGASLQASSSYHRALLAFGAACCVAALCLTYARGAVVIYGAVVACTPLVWPALRRWLHQSWQRILASVSVFIFGILLMTVFTKMRAISGLAAEMQTLLKERDGLDLRLERWRAVLDVILDYRLTGVGRGAYDRVFFQYSPMGDLFTYRYVENEWVQTVCDWGIPAASVMIVALLWLFMRAWRDSHTSAVRRSLCVGLAFLGIYNLADFNLQTMGVVLPASMLLAYLQPRFNSPLATPPAVLVTSGLIVATLVVMIGTPIALDNSIDKNTDALKAVLKSESDGDVRKKQVDAIISKHPADYFMPLLVAEKELSQAGGAPRALPWINRALNLAPLSKLANRQAGRAFFELGYRGQALLQYRLVLEQTIRLAATPEREWHVSIPIFEEVMEITGDPNALVELDPKPLLVRLDWARRLKELDAPEAGLRLMEGVEPDTADNALKVARALFELGAPEQAIEYARKAVKLRPLWYEPYVLWGRILESKQELEQSLSIYNAALNKVGWNRFLFRKLSLMFFKNSGGTRRSRSWLFRCSQLHPDLNAV